MMDYVVTPTRTIATEPTSGPVRTVKFGDVVVSGPEPSEAEVEESLRISAEGLKRAMEALLHPGIRLDPKPGVPLYWADPDNRGLLVRELDGKRERGVLKDGVFEPVS